MVSTFRGNIVIILILGISVYLRFHNLLFQSLWLDELHTMKECNPDLPWIDFFKALHNNEPHPPLYFIIIRTMMGLFSYHEMVPRAFSAFIGVVAIYGIYLLGKELKNKEVGLIGAFISSFNIYQIQFSQEARGYILAILFSICSFLYFIRLYKTKGIGNAIVYCGFTVALMYTHYYGVFVFASQILLFVMLLLTYRNSKGIDYYYHLVSFLVIVFSYLFWLPVILNSSFIDDFWIKEVPENFVLLFFKEYFGGNVFIYCIILLAILFAIVKRDNYMRSAYENWSYSMGVLVLLVWVFTVYLSGFFVSYIIRPSLITRYTIIVLPSIILIAAMGFERIKFQWIKYLGLSVLFLISTYDLFMDKKFYTTHSKTQFDKLTEYIAFTNRDLPIINLRTGWHQEYYFSKLNVKPRFIYKKGGLDSILCDQRFKDLNGFWLVSAHNEPELTEQQEGTINALYFESDKKAYFDCCARLFIAKGENNQLINVWKEDSLKESVINSFPKNKS